MNDEVKQTAGWSYKAPRPYF